MIFSVINCSNGGAWERQLEYYNYCYETETPIFLLFKGGYSDAFILKQKKAVTYKQVRVSNNFLFNIVTLLTFYHVKIVMALDISTVLSFQGNPCYLLFPMLRVSHPKIRRVSFLRGTEFEKAVEISFKKKSRVINWLKIGIIKIQTKYTQSFIFQSSSGAQNFQKKFRTQIDEQRIEILPNNWNTNRYLSLHETSDISFDQKVFNILFVGRIASYTKGIDILIETFQKLLTVHGEEKLCLHIVGDGPDFHSLSKHQSANILFYGKKDNPYSFYKEADLTVVPSRIEPFPNVMLEAISMDCPVVGTDVDGIPEIIRDKRFMFNANSSSLFELLNSLVTEKNLYDELCEQMRESKKLFEFDWCKRLGTILHHFGELKR
jgi:glycosyltransferase involved in cell wall biosynthesis